jgi:voltage-gated potassium channel
VARANVIERRMTKFLREPASVRNAVSVIVVATAVVVVLGGVLMRVLDHTEYKNIWVGMWWGVQTVTTVGYGDVTPHKPIGRIVATVMMLYGIGFLTITIAAITSTFVARAESERRGARRDDAELRAQLKEVTERLDRVEPLLRELSDRR